MKQTAVQWLMHQMLEASMDRQTGEMYIKLPKDAFTIAKAMEKEQMINFAEFVATYPDKNINISGEMLHAKSKYDGAERTIDLLEIFTIVP